MVSLSAGGRCWSRHQSSAPRFGGHCICTLNRPRCSWAHPDRRARLVLLMHLSFLGTSARMSAHFGLFFSVDEKPISRDDDVVDTLGALCHCALEWNGALRAVVASRIYSLLSLPPRTQGCANAEVDAIHKLWIECHGIHPFSRCVQLW